VDLSSNSRVMLSSSIRVSSRMAISLIPFSAGQGPEQ
jgi:hypothetical protein